MDIEKEAKAAQKRLAKYIDKLVEKAKADTAKDFEEARKKMKVEGK
jgi:predicted nucleotide-binding protein (sugar kinase/HSP70/actin superfamily)